MIDPVAIVRDGHTIFLKWHRARRRATDPVFTGRRILEGMALGASVEVDIVLSKDRQFVVLHDNVSIARETTGTGSALEHTAAELRALNLRDNDGDPIPDRVMLLEDLCDLLRQSPPHSSALLQLDCKEGDTALDPVAVANFARATTPFAKNMIVSGGSAPAIKLLTDAVPGMLSGYDPSDELDEAGVHDLSRLRRFVDDSLATAPDADFIYLYWQIVTEAARAGFDIVEAFHRAGRRIDAWTIKAADAETRPVVEQLLALKVDQITTDDPEGLAALMVPA